MGVIYMGQCKKASGLATQGTAHKRDRDGLKKFFAEWVLQLEHPAVMVTRLKKRRNAQ